MSMSTEQSKEIDAGLHPVVREIVKGRRDTAPINAIIELAAGALEDWRITDPKEFVETRTRQLNELIDTLVAEVHGEDLKTQLRFLLDGGKGQEALFLEQMFAIRNKITNGKLITEDEIRERINGRLVRFMDLVQGDLASVIDPKNPRRQKVLELAIKHFVELTGEKIVPSAKE